MVNQPIDAVAKCVIKVRFKIKSSILIMNIKVNDGDQAEDGDGQAGSIFKVNT